MGVTWQTPGNHNGGVGSCVPTWPSGLGIGEMAPLFIAWGNATNDPPPTPSGFIAPPNNVIQGGSGSWGVDTGLRGISFFYRITDGTESASPTINNGGSGTDRLISAQIGRLTKSLPDWAAPQVAIGNDNSAGTGFSITADRNLVAVNGDVGVTFFAWAPDTVGLSGAATVAWDGVGTAVTQWQSIANSNGNDLRLIGVRRTLLGNGGSPPVLTATAAASVVGGAAGFVLFHDGPAPSGWGISI